MKNSKTTIPKSKSKDSQTQQKISEFEIPPRCYIRVLLVEDNQGYVKFLKEVFFEATESLFNPIFEITHQNTVQDALNYLENHSIDLVLLDLHLPDSRGFSTFQTIHECVKGVPIVILSGALDHEIHIQAMRAGAQDYLVKGETSPEIVLRSVLYSLERHSLRDELMRNKEELRTSNDNLLLILERNADGIIIADKNKIIQFANASARKILNAAKPELIGTEVWFPIPTGMTECVFHPSIEEAQYLELVTGEIEWLGKPAKMISIRDTTERRKIENRLRNSQKIEALGRLAGGVAHEFNNILAIIGGFNQLVLRSSSDLEEAKPWLRKVDGAVKRGTQLATQLLGFTRQGKYEPESLTINEIITNTIEMINPTIKRTVQVESRFVDPIYSIFGDYAQLESIFVNLFINADDAMEDGGQLLIEVENRSIDVEETLSFAWYMEPGDYVEIKVTDNGSGMEPGIVDKVFEPFFTTKEPGKGTGLGLANVYGIVKNHGGHILCKSIPNEGTTFEILLPSYKENKNELIQKKFQEIQKTEVGAKGLVLIVDDEMDILYLLKEMLSDIGYTSLWATNGVEAVQVYEQSYHNLCAVLLDLRMPVMPGTETFMKMREISPSVPIILLSGFHKDKEVDLILEKGAEAFIQKPYSLDEISEILDSVKGKAQLQ